MKTYRHGDYLFCEVPEGKECFMDGTALLIDGEPVTMFDKPIPTMRRYELKINYSIVGLYSDLCAPDKSEFIEAIIQADMVPENTLILKRHKIKA